MTKKLLSIIFLLVFAVQLLLQSLNLADNTVSNHKSDVVLFELTDSNLGFATSNDVKKPNRQVTINFIRFEDFIKSNSIRHQLYLTHVPKNLHKQILLKTYFTNLYSTAT